MIELRTTNARGVLCGESQPMCKWPDTLVAEAKVLRAQGMTIEAITARLNGPHHSTVWRWVNSITRKPPAKVVARRIKSNTYLYGIGSAANNDKGLRSVAELSIPEPIPNAP